MKMLHFIDIFAHSFAGIIMAYSIGVNGPYVIGSLAFFVLVVYIGQVVIILWNIGMVGLVGLNMWEYIKNRENSCYYGIYDLLIYGLSLPFNIECVEKSGVPKGIGTFGVTLGCTVNMAGTAFFQAVSVIFHKLMVLK